MVMTCPACGRLEGHLLTEERGRYRMFRCPDCTVEFSDPMESSLGDEQIAAVYEGRTQCVGQYLGWFHREFLQTLPARAGTLLDIGCGTGDFVSAARRCGYDAMGIDTDWAAIQAGRSHHGELPLLCVTAEGFFQQDTRRYDVITFFEVLEHLEDPNRFAAMVRGHLNAGGWVALSVPNNDSVLLRAYRIGTRVIDYPPHHLTRWSKKAVQLLLNTHGFDVLRMAVLRPSITDIVPDACRMRLRMLQPKTRARIARGLQQTLRPLDLVVRTVVREGRGMFLLARAR